ncbi:hypothetical protein P0D88_52265 [Paraburkholderia sp. RL18-103-BIB-C]|jgi:hypothetical protein|uniref:hypothetical protein n=1 Tax=Burkholderiaceae TaxID=119060 RepID=UPI0038BCF7F5
MAKTVAQRQAQYRARRQMAGPDGNGERQLSMWIGTSAFLGLARLACRYGVTKRELIEGLIKIEDDRVIATLELDTPEWDEYFASSTVTQ